MAGLSEWRGYDRYGEDILLFKFDWRDEQVMAWIERFTRIAGQDTLGNVERQNVKDTGRLMRSLFWKTWAVEGGAGQVFDARYVYYAKFVELALGKGGALLRYLSLTDTAHFKQSLQTGHLGRVDADLPTGDIADFHVVENLHIGLSHLHANVVAGLLQVLRGSLKVQSVQLDGVRYLETREDRHTGAQRERR